jgi:hypothetical protein
MTLSLQRGSLHALLAATSRYFQISENLDSAHTPAVAIFRYFAQVRNPETSLGLRTPCTAPVPKCTLGEREQELNYMSPSSTHSLRTTSTAPLAGISCSDRETIETHSSYSSSLRFQTLSKKSFIHSIKAIA